MLKVKARAPILSLMVLLKNKYPDSGRKVRVFMADGSIKFATTTMVHQNGFPSCIVFYDQSTRKDLGTENIKGWLYEQ